MPDLMIVSKAERTPGYCFWCHGTTGPFVDTIRDVLPHGRVYFCIGTPQRPGCVTQMASAIGYAAPEVVAELDAMLGDAHAEIERLERGVTVGRPIEYGELSFELRKHEARIVARLQGEDPDEAEAAVEPEAAPAPELVVGRGTILLEDVEPPAPAEPPMPRGALREPLPEDPDRAEVEAAPEARAPDPRRAAMEAARARATGALDPGEVTVADGASMAELDAAYSEGPEAAPEHVRQALAGAVEERTGVAPPPSQQARQRRRR